MKRLPAEWLEGGAGHPPRMCFFVVLLPTRFRLIKSFIIGQQAHA
jgi:hypothetical protein